MTHREIRPSDRGTLKELLTRSYQPLKELNEPPWVPGDGMWHDYDDRIFGNLARIDECVFLTESDHPIVGFASFTCKELEATIGRNSVLPEHGGKGIGSGQVAEIVRRCIALNVKTIHVMTGTHRFFIPARKMYLKAGFKEVSRDDDGQGVGRILVRYRLDL